MNNQPLDYLLTRQMFVKVMFLILTGSTGFSVFIELLNPTVNFALLWLDNTLGFVFFGLIMWVIFAVVLTSLTIIPQPEPDTYR